MRRWNWIEDGILPLAVAILTSAWLGLWVRWSVRALPPEQSAPALAPEVLALLLLAGAAVTRLVMSGDRLDEGSPTSARMLITAAGLAAIVGAAWYTYRFGTLLEYVRALVEWGDFISPVFVGLVASAFVWWQGILVGQSALPQEDLERAFYGGVIALALLFGMNSLRTLIAPGEALGAALIFFATGLASLALVSVENARRWQAADAVEVGTWPALNRYWLATVASVIGIILLGGVAAAGLFAPETFERLDGALSTLLNGLIFGLILIVATVVFVAAWLVLPLIENVVATVGSNPFRFPPPPSPSQVARDALESIAQNPVLGAARQTLFLLLILAVLVLGFWWAVRRIAAIGRQDVDETRESIATRDLLVDQLRSLFAWRRPRTSTPLRPYLTLTGSMDDPRLIVRRAYQAMLEWAQSFSAPRAAGQTPAAYAETLSSAVPQGREAISILTRAYVLARYAAESPSLDEARRAERAVTQLRAIATEGGTHFPLRSAST